MQEAMTKVFHVYPEVKVIVYIDDMKLHVRGQNKELANRTKGMFEALK